MSDPFRLVLISAWNDSGGGFLHRLFDGHPECFVYPFELQLGTALLHDGFESWFRPKYRWPILPEDLGAASPEQLFELFLDDEVKGCLRGRAASKFREFDLELSMEAWRTQFAARLGAAPRTPERVIAAYVGGLFAAWRNRRGSGREPIYLGHCRSAWATMPYSKCPPGTASRWRAFGPSAACRWCRPPTSGSARTACPSRTEPSLMKRRVLSEPCTA